MTEDRPVIPAQRVRLTRLDQQGQPTGEPFDLPPGASFSVNHDVTFVTTGTEDKHAAMFTEPHIQRATIEVKFKDVSPDVLGLILGLTRWQLRKLRLRALVRRVAHRG